MAHFRESNAVHLEVLEQAISVGVPIEVDIFDGANPGTMLEHLEGAEGVKFSLTMNEEGAGEFRLSRGDPKATPEIIDREHLAKIKIGGIYRFSFWMENRKIVTLTENEEAGEFWHVSGREGVYAYIDRATMDRISRIGDDPIEGVWDLTAAGTGNKLGQMLRRVLDESLAKTPSPLEFLTLSFDYDVDSQGAAWATDADVQVNVGTHLLPLAKMLSALGMDLRGRHDLRLSAFEDLGRHFEVDGGTGEVVFRAGQNVTTSLERTSEPGIRSRMLVKGTGDEFFEVLRPDLEADPYIRRREGFLSFGNSDDPTTVQRAAEAELAALASRRSAISFGADHDRSRGGYEPFVDYDLGDWTTLDEPGVFDMETVRIVGITVEQEEDDFRVILDANSIVLEELLKVARRVQNSGGGGGGGGASTSSIGGGGGGGGSITSPAKVAVEAGDTPGFLYGKLQAGDGMTASLAGAAGNRRVKLDASIFGLGGVDLTGLEDGDGIVYDEASGLFLPGAAGGGGGEALPVPDYSRTSTQVSASSSQVIHSRAFANLPAGRYLLIGKAWIWSSGIGTLYIRANGVEIGGRDDPRMDVAQRILFAYYSHPGGAVTFEIFHSQESGTTQYGSGGDPRFSRELLVVPLGTTSAVTAAILGSTLATKIYSPAADTTVNSTTSATSVDVDATNLVVTFTVPPSGAVLVRLSALQQSATGVTYWQLREGTTVVRDTWIDAEAVSRRLSAEFYVSGLTPGDVKTWKWGFRRGSGGTSYIFAGTPSYGAAIMEVRAA